MEFIQGSENENVRKKALELMNSFYEQLNELNSEDTEPWRKQIISAQGIKNKRNIIRKLMEINLPACATLLDKFIEESKNHVLENLEYLSGRQSVAMSLESFVSAQNLAEKAHSIAKKLYQSSKENSSDPGAAAQEIYNAYFRSCVDLFIVYRYQGKLEHAKEFLEEAKNVAQEANEEDDLDLICIFEGELCLAKGLLNKAISEFFTPLKNKQNISDENAGLLLQKLGNACRSAAQWGPAKAHLRKSIEIARNLGDQISEYDRITDLGNVYRSEGRIADAIEQQSCHTVFAFERGDLWGLTVACFNMGFSYYSMQPKPALDRALNLLLVKYELAARTCNEVLRGMALNNLGKIFCAQGQYDTAVKAFKKCVEISKKTGNFGGEGMAYGNLGTAYRAMGQFDDAIKHHEMYRKNAIGRGDDGGVAIMQRELAWDYLLKKDFKNAEEQAKNSVVTSELIRQKLGTEDTSKLANFDKNQSEAYNLLQVSLVNQGRTEEALAFSEFARARAITDIIRDKSSQKGSSWLWKDISSRESLSLSLAEEIIQDFFKTADALNTNFLVYSVVTDYPTKEKKEKFLYIWLVKCCKDLGPDGQRITFRKLGLEYEIHGNLVSDEKFFTSLTRAFRCINMHKTAPVSLLQTDKEEPVEKSDEKVDLVFPKGKSAERFLRLLNSLSLTPSSISENTERSQERQKPEYEDDGEKPASQDSEISHDTTEDFAEIIRYADYGSWHTEGLKQLSFLYNICIAPIEDSLPCVTQTHVPRITIIPQEFLFSVPFCALFDERKQYLIERCVLSYAPSLKALCHLQQRLIDLRAFQGERKLKLLAVGDPKVSLPGIVDLPKSGIEAHYVGDVFGNEQCRVALRKEAKKSLVIQEIKNVDVLHLATHACPEIPDAENKEGNYLMQGCLLLAPSHDQCNGVLVAQEIADASCNCQLVLLSCCETGLGKLTGDGVVGLYRAFFAAGAACILVTLWKIRDDVTPLFMEKFYSVFKDSEDVPLALREAMLFFLKDKQYPPHEWAAFSAVGAFLSRKVIAS